MLAAHLTPLSAKTLIHAGTLIGGRADTPQKDATLTIEGDRLTAITPGYTAHAAGDTVIDLKNATVAPGWIDCHVHLDQQNSPTRYAERGTLNPGDHALRAAYYGKKTLLAGFTTVRVLGDINGSSVALRIAVRPRYKEGANCIKITATGGVLSLAVNGQNPRFTSEELRAVIETAHEYGLKVAAHAHGTEGMKRAVETGADSIEHGTYITEGGGMTPMAAFKSATLEPGKYADFVALPGDPLTDMTLVLKPGFVMKGGVIYKQP